MAYKPKNNIKQKINRLIRLNTIDKVKNNRSENKKSYALYLETEELGTTHELTKIYDLILEPINFCKYICDKMDKEYKYLKYENKINIINDQLEYLTLNANSKLYALIFLDFCGIFEGGYFRPDNRGCHIECHDILDNNKCIELRPKKVIYQLFHNNYISKNTVLALTFSLRGNINKSQTHLESSQEIYEFVSNISASYGFNININNIEKYNRNMYFILFEFK